MPYKTAAGNGTLIVQWKILPNYYCQRAVQKSLNLLICQAGKLKNFWHSPELGSLLYSLYTILLPRPVVHSPGQIFTRIGERASATFPACMSTCRYVLWTSCLYCLVLISVQYIIIIWQVELEKKSLKDYNWIVLKKNWFAVICNEDL